MTPIFWSAWDHASAFGFTASCLAGAGEGLGQNLSGGIVPAIRRQRFAKLFASLAAEDLTFISVDINALTYVAYVA
jgi:hypothetical protein